MFGASNDPRILDPALASDGESLRVSSQIYETLVTTAPGSTEVIPQLATEWSASEDGLDWTFELQQGVTFHDGEPFNAAAVCFNFDRWYNFTGPLQLNSGAYYWRVIFGGFAAERPGLRRARDVAVRELRGRRRRHRRSCTSPHRRPPSSAGSCCRRSRSPARRR